MDSKVLDAKILAHFEVAEPELTVVLVLVFSAVVVVVVESELSVVLVLVFSAAVLVVVVMVVEVGVLLEELNWISATFKAENIFEQAVAFCSFVGLVGV